jgi:capsid protein
MSVLGNIRDVLAGKIEFAAIRAKHNAQALRDISRGRYNSGYDNGRRRDRITGGTESEDHVLRMDYPYMVASAMHVYRNNPLARSIVDTVTRYMGQSRPTATTRDPEWNKRATEYVNEYWWHQADARARQGVDFGTLQDQWNFAAFTMGDVLFQPVNGRLFTWEGVQIMTPAKLSNDPDVINGVRVRAAFPHTVSHYYVCETGRYGMPDRQKFHRLSRWDAFYSPARIFRPAQIRAVPDLHGVIDALRDFDDTADGVRSKVKFDTMILTKEREGAVNTAGGRLLNRDASGGKSEITRADNMMRVKVNGDPSDFEVHEMKNPNGEYVPFMEFDSRLITSGVGFPAEIALHLYTNGSYTANRAARCDFKKYILDRWAWRNKVMLQPIWNWVIAGAINRGLLPPAPANPDTGVSEWYKAAWSLPYFEQIDEGKEAAADKKRWDIGQESGQDWAQERQMSVDQMLERRDEFITDCATRAAKHGLTLREYMPGLFVMPAKEEAPNDRD